MVTTLEIAEPHLNASVFTALAVWYGFMTYSSKFGTDRASVLTYSAVSMAVFVIAFYAALTFIPQIYPL